MTAQVVASQRESTLRSDARDNHRRILAIARAAFADEGFDMPVREIARRAQVGVATVYRHFGTKEALVAEAFAGHMASCGIVVAEGLAASDPWLGFCLVAEKLMAAHALAAQRPPMVESVAERDRTLGMLRELVRRAKQAGPLRKDFVLEDLGMALMANQGIQAESPEMGVAASRRFAALMIQSFQANPVPTPLPPAVWLPLTRR